MGWRERLRDLAIAGGLAAGAPACGGVNFTCNAVPDPCCAAPESAQCAVWNSCRASGGNMGYVTTDGGQLVQECLGPDGGPIDGGH